MTEAAQEENSSRARGGEDSVVEAFGIRGLYGYRSISLSSEFAATILIARNGTGKTTLLGALDAFLRQQFSRLRDLDFEEIYCKIRGIDHELTLTRQDLDSFLDVAPGEEFLNEFVKFSRGLESSPTLVFRFLSEEWPSLKADFRSAADNTTFAAILRTTDFNTRKAIDICEKLSSGLLARSPKLSAISETLQKVLAGFDIVYLPTYRRVELALGKDSSELPHRKKRPKFNVAAGSLFTGDIQFGLADISERLSEMNTRIVSESNSGYRQISANIINELIDGSYERETDANREIPSRDDLQLFFSRLERSRRVESYPISIPNLDKIYSEDGVPDQSGKFLNYFLSQLGTVIRATTDIERSVQDFVSSCNKYLLSEEVSTLLPAVDLIVNGRLIDGKKLRLNRKDLKVHVESVPEGRQISLDALSSGEKQMISLFAKLFLYEGPKIVLIDEPELSLSIDWQRHILVDVMNAPLCRQLIAITHSPFVFDNDLEPFARSLQLSASAAVLSPVEGDDADE